MKQNQKGITIVGLLITVIVIVTIAGVCINTGRDILEEAKLEQLKTNMLLIQAKCQSVGERVTAKELESKDYIGTAVSEIEGSTIADGDIWYGLTEKDIEEKEYVIIDESGVEATKTGVGLGDIIKLKDGEPENKKNILF